MSERAYRAYVLRKVLGMYGIDLNVILRATRYRFDLLDRVVLYRAWDEFLGERNISLLDALEVSPGENSRWRSRGFGTYASVQFPTFDICRDKLDRRFDVIIIDNVLEHVPSPSLAVRNAFDMLRSDGYLMVSTPFLAKIHGAPDDFSRWTENGMRRLMEGAGFLAAEIRTGSWGNRACVKANLDQWALQGWRRRLTNEPGFPVMVWAICRRL